MEQRSKRLKLVAATPALAKAETEDSAHFAALLGATIPSEWPPETLRDVLPVFARQHEAHPDWTGWLGWYAIRFDSPSAVLCGSVGFKGPPNAAGMVEIGYSLLPTHRQQGLATEMVHTLIRWACSQPSVRAIEAETTMENRPSIRVLERNGFHPVVLDSNGSVRYRLVCHALGAA